MTPCCCVAAVVLAAVTQAAAHSVPNIAGTWVIVPEASVWRDRNGNPVNIRIFGDGFVAGQDDRILTIAINNERGFEWRYSLDGSESHNVAPLAQGSESTTSTVTAQSNKITIRMRSSYQGASRTTIRTIELHGDGTVRVEAPFGEGGAMIGSVYRRVEDVQNRRSVRGSPFAGVARPSRESLAREPRSSIATSIWDLSRDPRRSMQWPKM
jgi:hypothetical protein